MTRKLLTYGCLALFMLPLAACDSVMGSKEDETTREIFEAGRNDPTLLNEVEYVPLFPFYETGADGVALESPKDVYAGYDEFLYVVDDRGLHVFDLSGRPATFLPIEGGGTSVVQDRRLSVYVTARRDTLLNGQTWDLPVVLRYDGITTGAPVLADIIWHPFDDDSRKFNAPDPITTDEAVSFTGVGVLYDNHIYVSRRGPINPRGTFILPHNTIMEFDEEGTNIQSIVTLHPTRESLRSSLFPVDVVTYVHPPQRSFYSQTRDFILLQSSSLNDVVSGGGLASQPLRYSALSIRVVPTSDGVEYRPDTDKLRIAGDLDKGDSFLYDEFRFNAPTDVTIAADGSNFIFVTDGGSDSLHVFTGQGIEGVTPPPGSRSTRPVNVSFGGTGDGALQFNAPQGVAYFQRIVYVADTGNNRIGRFRLNTDFE
ncbi:MAG: hypothetical protein O2797_03840 [Bacteroidetes bacterium]|nr:hypothetical protein [Bacteroidota bacterium]MDA1333335.1 hypothetical protein [Bacteroidota bacterium]